jgi:hypothetical protein
MYVRLAFAVAAHLDPEILVIDEVLAVGDAEFRRKCLGKMDEVAQHGRTVLFVSHQMNQIRRLCRRAIWLEGGRVRADGSAGDVVSAYEASASGGRQADVDDVRGATRFLTWSLSEPASEEPHHVSAFAPTTITVDVAVAEPLQRLVTGFALWDGEDRLVWGYAFDIPALTKGVHRFSYAFPLLPLKPGCYHLQLTLFAEGKLIDSWFAVPDLVVATEPQSHGDDKWNGYVNMPCTFACTDAGPQ